ncbi:uncharacterized protein [Ambystoma mexicanum]|uniref:uncharacterized protein n=1 Tax=Ambystoma mexicanum TaxID=8296 RepID=UPI0037E96F6C
MLFSVWSPGCRCVTHVQDAAAAGKMSASGPRKYGTPSAATELSSKCSVKMLPPGNQRLKIERAPRSLTADPNTGRAKTINIRLFRERTVGCFSRPRAFSVRGTQQEDCKEVLAFPPISKKTIANSASNTMHRSLVLKTPSKNLQEMFFSLQISNSPKSLAKLIDFRESGIEDRHWNIPTRTLSGEMETYIKSHLKDRMQHRHGRRRGQAGRDETSTGDGRQYIKRSTEAFKIGTVQGTEDQQLDSKPDRILTDNFQGVFSTDSLDQGQNDFSGTSMEILTRADTNEWTLPTTLHTAQLVGSETDCHDTEIGNVISLEDGLVETISPTTASLEGLISKDNSSSGAENVPCTASTGICPLLPQDSPRSRVGTDSVPAEENLPMIQRRCEELEEDEPGHIPYTNTEQDILRGRIDALYSRGKKIFKIYICGGYQDSQPERDALFEKVYPNLYAYCKERGYHFKMFDLRWGLADGVTNDHTTTLLHLKTLQECQDSGQPHFFSFLGQKHDHLVLPVSLSQKDFQTIKGTIEKMKMETIKQKQSKPAALIGADEPDGQVKSLNGLDSGQLASQQSEASTHEFKARIAEAHCDLKHELKMTQDGQDAMQVNKNKSVATYDKEIGLLTQWYRLDENCIPSVYKLQTISTYLGDIFSKDPVRRQQAKSKWLSTRQKLHEILQEYASAALGKEAAANLLRTVMQQELHQSFQVPGVPEDHCHCFKRVITDLQYNLSSKTASGYIDILPLKPEINKELHEAHQSFIKSIHSRLRHTNIYDYSVSWGWDGINAKTNRSHAYYLERICIEFQKIVISQFNRMTSSQKFPGVPDARSRKQVIRILCNEEILEHAEHCHRLLKVFIGREACLQDLQHCVQSSNRRLVLLHGEAGCGKSAIMAKAALLLPTWIPGDMRVVLRFVGVTGESRNVRLMLRNLCYQIAKIYSIPTKISEDLKQLVNEFSTLLEFATAKQPLAILIDGLDELSEDGEFNLSWLPAELPLHVCVVISTTTKSEHSCFKALEKCTVPSSILQVPPLSSVEIQGMTASLLERDQRRLTHGQEKALLEACVACPIPLYVVCAYRESSAWTSFSLDKEICLPPDLPKIFSTLLDRMEKNHGVQVVKKTLGYIALARNGITEEELLDLLSLDRAVMLEIKEYQKVSAPLFPQGLWLKLRSDLGAHLVEQRTEQTYVFRWAHSAVRQACINRYLKAKELQLTMHSTIADYYLGSKTRHAARKGDEQYVPLPLAWILKMGSKTNYVFNLRKLLGTSYHLIQSNQISRLMTECLFKYEYLLHKIWASSIVDVEEDFRAAVSPERPTADLTLLLETLKLSRNVLLKDPCQLASQIVGRLHQIIEIDKPIAPGDPRVYPFSPALLTDCLQSSIPALVPAFSCLLPPGGLHFESLAGHMDRITAVGETQTELMVVTTSKDGTLKLWDVPSGKAIFTLHGVGRNIDSITVCHENKLVAVTENNSFQVWDLSQRKMIHAAKGFVDAPILTSAMDGQLLLAFFDGSHLIKVFDLANSCKLLCEVEIPPDDAPIHKDRSILVSKNSVKEYVLFAYRSGMEARVFSARKGVVVTKLTAQDPAASVQGVAVTKDYFVMICRYPSLKMQDTVHIELFSTKNFEFIRSIKGCGSDFISTFSVNRQGSHVIAFSPLPNTNTTEIVVWNLETEDHKHIAKFCSVPNGGVCFDLRYCLAFSDDDNYLKSWNLASRINDQSLSVMVNRGKKPDGIQEIVVMEHFPRYVVCRSVRPGVITVWNIVKSKCKSSAVRVERGLVESSDIVLVKDMKLFVLTDRGMASFTETPRPLFQTLLTYDLLKKKYVRKQTGLYIIPCPKHEYRILDGGLLLGLSENRDHFVIWSLDTGFIKHRIRPDYKEKPSLLNLLPDHSAPNDTSSSEAMPRRRQGKETAALLTPWERRNETKTGKKRRLDREVRRETEKLQQIVIEKSNAIDQYLLSGNEKVIVCSYYAHHLCVFSLESMSHLHTLENRTSMLFLHHAALTYTGSYLALSNYSDDEKISYITLWDLGTGTVKKKLKKEPNVCCMAITDDASRIVFGITVGSKLKVWDPFRSGHKVIRGYENMHLKMNSKLQVIEGGAKAILLTDEVSLWDLDAGTFISIFTPDSKICCLSLAADRKTMLVGMSDSPALITLKLASKDKINLGTIGGDLFGEDDTSSEDEVDENEQVDKNLGHF